MMNKKNLPANWRSAWLPPINNAIKLLSLLLVVSISGGCATASKHQQTVATDGSEASEKQAPVIDFQRVNDPYFHLIVAELARQNRQWQQAQLSYQYALRDSSVAEIARNGFHMSLMNNDATSAEVFAKRWQELDPHPESTAALATALVRNGEVGKAVETFAEFVDTFPSNGDDPFESVAAMLSRPEFGEHALPVMEGVVQKYPQQATAALNLARLAYRLEQLNKAYMAANRALELDADLIDARLVRAQVLLSRGDAQSALSDLQDVLKEQPYNVRILNTLANIYMRQGDQAKADRMLERVLSVAPDDATAILAMAKTAVKNKNYPAASRYFLRLYELNEEPSLAAYYLGAIAEEADEYDKSIDWYRRVRGGPQLERAQERIAAVMVRQGDLGLAREHVQNVRSALPQLAARFYLLEAEMLHADERPDSALKVFEKAISEFPKDVDLRYSRSLLLVELGAYGLAEKDLLVALESAPDDAKILNALGYTLADNTDRYDEAYGYIAKALDIQPDSPSILDSMGWVLFHQGKLDLAVEYLRKAYSKMQEAEIAAHLGEALWMQGELLDAESVWRRAWSRSGTDGRKILQDTVDRVAPNLAPNLLKGTE